MKQMLMVAAVAAALGAAACGEDEDEAAPAQAAAAVKATADGDYKPVSDVAAHAAIGRDMALIRERLEEGDFAAAAAIWSDGRSSRKDDGAMRTLAGFVEGHPVAERVADALSGRRTARRLNPDQRRQWVDKGMVVAIEAKVLDELDAAIEKASAGETDDAEGAPHNVDEAWAFFTAGGQGLIATADKRAADFGLEGKVAEPVLAALGEAQAAARAGDGAALMRAREAARGAMNRIFALAVTKYASEGIDDGVARAEGLAFSWGLQGDLPRRDLAAIEAAFGPSAGYRTALRVREAINARLAQLGVSDRVPAYGG